MRIVIITSEIANKYKEEIAKLYYDNVHSCLYFEHYTINEANTKIDSFVDHINSGTALGFAVLDDDKLCGFIWAYQQQFREEQRMYVNEIRVLDEYRHIGIGTELLMLVEDEAKKRKIGAIYLHTEANNVDARKFYDACGYKEERIQLRKPVSK